MCMDGPVGQEMSSGEMSGLVGVSGGSKLRCIPGLSSLKMRIELGCHLPRQGSHSFQVGS